MMKTIVRASILLSFFLTACSNTAAGPDIPSEPADYNNSNSSVVSNHSNKSNQQIQEKQELEEEKVSEEVNFDDLSMIEKTSEALHRGVFCFLDREIMLQTDRGH